MDYFFVLILFVSPYALPFLIWRKLHLGVDEDFKLGFKTFGGITLVLMILAYALMVLVCVYVFLYAAYLPPDPQNGLVFLIVPVALIGIVFCFGFLMVLLNLFYVLFPKSQEEK
jgi:hypothetical protein